MRLQVVLVFPALPERYTPHRILQIIHRITESLFGLFDFTFSIFYGVLCLIQTLCSLFYFSCLFFQSQLFAIVLHLLCGLLLYLL
ncbi:hypothetical protein D3C72_1716120 [compost metagenome]